MGKEAQDTAKTATTEGKTLKTHPDLNQWSSKEINARKMEIMERFFRLQTLIMDADRKIYLTSQELNASTNEGDSEAAAKLVFILGEAKRELATLNTEKRKLAAEKQLLEKEYRYREDRLHDSPKVYLADGKNTRVM